MNNVFRIQALMTLTDFISGPLEAIRRSFRATAQSADGLGDRIDLVKKRFAPFAIAAGLLIGGMTATALATTETSKALGELGTLGAQNLEMFRTKAMQVSNQWAGVDAPQFISAAYDVKSALSDLSESAQADITELASITALATKASVEEMTSYIGKAYNIMGKSADFEGMAAPDIAAQLFAGMASSVREFMTTGPAMRQSLMSMGNAATIAGIGIKEQYVALGLLNNAMDAATAGTGFKTLSNKLPQVAKELGLNFRDATGKMLPLPNILDMITNAVGDLSTDAAQIRVISLFGEEAANTFKTLATQTDTMRQKTIAVGTAMNTGRGFLEAMAKSANEHLGANMEKAGHRLSNLIQMIGSMFVPVLNTTIQFVSWLAMGIQRLVEVANDHPFAIWTIQMTALLTAGVAVVGMLGALRTLMPGLIALVGTYATAMWTAAAATVATYWPIYALMAVAGLLYLAFKQNFMGIGDTIKGWYNTVTLVIAGVKAVFAGLKGDTYTITGGLAKDLRAAGLVGVVDTIAGVLYRVWQIFKGIGDVVVPVTRVVGTILRPAWWMLSDTISGVISVMKSLWGIIVAIATPFIKLISLVNPNIWHTLGVVIGVVASAIGILASAIAILFVGNTIGWVAFFAATIWGIVKIFQLVGMIAEWAVQKLSAFLNLPVVMGAILMGVTGTIQRIIGRVAEIKRFLGSINLREEGAKFWHTFISGITAGVSAMVDAVRSGLQKVRNLLPHSDAKEGPLSTLTLSGSRLLTTFGSGVDRAVPALRRSVAIALTGLMPMTAGAAPVTPPTPVIKPAVVTAPAPVVTPSRPVLTPATPVSLPAPAIIQAVPATPIPQVMTTPAPVITQAAPVISAPASVSVASPVVTQHAPIIPAAKAVIAPAPVVTPAAPNIIPAAPIRMHPPEIVQPSAELPSFEPAPLPEPVRRETIRERTTVETQSLPSSAPTSSGETRRYTINISNLTLSNVTDARSFVEELTALVDSYDGGADR